MKNVMAKLASCLGHTSLEPSKEMQAEITRHPRNELADLLLSDTSSRTPNGLHNAFHMPRLMANHNGRLARSAPPLLGSKDDYVEPSYEISDNSAVDQAVYKMTQSPLFRLFIPMPQEMGINLASPMYYQNELVEIVARTGDTMGEEDFAAPVSGDGKEEALLRPLLRLTQLEVQKLKLVYNSRQDGFSATKWHSKVDSQGPCIVVAKTAGGALCGGFAPKGVTGDGQARGAPGAFLFTWPDGDTSKPAIKIPVNRNLGIFSNANGAVLNAIDDGIAFGTSDFVVKMATEGDCTAISKLGQEYQKKVDTLFAPEDDSESATLTELRTYIGVWEPLVGVKNPIPWAS